MTITTPFGNFNNPKDLNHYMTDENIDSVTLTCVYFGATISKDLTLTKREVELWADGKDMITQQPIEDVAGIRKRGR